MNIEDAVQEVAYRLGNRNDLNTRIKAEMGDIQEFTLEIVSVLPWWMITTDTDLATVAGTESISLPASFIRECEDSALWRYDATAEIPWVELKKTETDVLRRSIGITLDDTGKPRAYALSGTLIRFAPVPDAVYPLKMRYYKRDTNARGLNTGETNNWLTYAADLMIAETCVVMGRQLRYRQDAQQQFEQDRREAQDRYIRQIHGREHANKRYVMGI